MTDIAMSRAYLAEPGRWVIKIGSAVLTNNGLGLDHNRINGWADDVAWLRERGHEVVLVSSGAVAEGLVRLGWKVRPKLMHQLQAAAAVGQTGLVGTYEQAFSRHGIRTAQVLLTADDLAHRRRYLNARSTVQELIALGVVPIINENDSVGTEEIRFGDNDTLAGLVANLIEADRLVILTDQDGLFDADPRVNPDAKIVREGLAGDPAVAAMAGMGMGTLGRGGMITKLRAAVLAARSGTDTLIAGGKHEAVIRRLASGELLGSLLKAGTTPVRARKQWLAGQLTIKGTLVLDDGAAKVLSEAGRSLLPVGILQVSGDFERGDLVSCRNLQGLELARGLANYSSVEAERIKGVASQRIESILGYCNDEEMIHRNNLVLTGGSGAAVQK